MGRLRVFVMRLLILLMVFMILCVVNTMEEFTHGLLQWILPEYTHQKVVAGIM